MWSTCVATVFGAITSCSATCGRIATFRKRSEPPSASTNTGAGPCSEEPRWRLCVFLGGDQLVQCATHVLSRDRYVPLRAVVAEEHEPSLLVTAERGPSAVTVDPDRAWSQHIFDDVRLAAREPQRCHQPACDGVPVRHFLVTGRRL